MRRTLRVLPDAEAELQSAAVWYEGKRRGLGVEFVAVEIVAIAHAKRRPGYWLGRRG
jgi:hypothetical protein